MHGPAPRFQGFQAASRSREAATAASQRNASFLRKNRRQKAPGPTAIMLCAAFLVAASHSLAATEVPASGSAVIIGNRDQEAPYAHRDATAFERFVLDVHRFDPDRIVLLRDATEAEITLAFQTAVHREAPVMLVYFSGRAVRGVGAGRGPVSLLLDNITKANARSVQVFLDTSSASKADQGLLRSFPKGPDHELTALVAAFTERNRFVGRGNEARTLHPAPSRCSLRLGRRQWRWTCDGKRGKGVPRRHPDPSRPPRTRHDPDRQPHRDTRRGSLDRTRGSGLRPAARSRDFRRGTDGGVPSARLVRRGSRGGVVAQPQRASTHTAGTRCGTVRCRPAGRHLRTTHAGCHRPVANGARATADRVSGRRGRGSVARGRSDGDSSRAIGTVVRRPRSFDRPQRHPLS